MTDGKQHPVAFCSRTLTVTEQQYAQIERECLACVWTCEKFTQYLLGLESYRLITDHKPVVPLIGEKHLNMVPLRCQRLLMRMMWFNPNHEYPGHPHQESWAKSDERQQRTRSYRWQFDLHSTDDLNMHTTSS